jgi:hypothetical protein
MQHGGVTRKRAPPPLFWPYLDLLPLKSPFYDYHHHDPAAIHLHPSKTMLKRSPFRGGRRISTGEPAMHNLGVQKDRKSPLRCHSVARRGRLQPMSTCLISLIAILVIRAASCLNN